MKENNSMNTINFIQCISVHSVVLIILSLKSLWTEPAPAFASGWQNMKNKLVFIRDNSWLNTTLKMQNKAKRKSSQIPATPYNLSTNKTTLHSPQPKNKPKQSQRNAGFPARAKARLLKPQVSSLKTVFMTSKPNFKTTQIAASRFLSKSYNYSPTTYDYKNKPNQSQFLSADFFLPRQESLVKSRLICNTLDARGWQ